MTPAPTTTSRFGTAGSDSAPVEETMRFSSTVDAGERRRLGAGGDDDGLGLHLAASCRLRPSTRTLPGPATAPVPRSDSILFFLNRYATPEVLASTTASLWPIIAGRFSFGVADLDAEGGEIVCRLLEQLGGVEQRLRRDAADIEAGAAEGRVLLDDGDAEAELAQRGWRRHSRRDRCR